MKSKTAWERIGLDLKSVRKMMQFGCTPDMENRLQALSVKEHAFYRTFGDLLRPEFFSSDEASRFAEMVAAFVEANNAPPDRISAVDFAQRWPGLTDEVRRRVIQHISAIYATPLIGVDYAKTVLLQEARRKALRAAAYRIVQLNDGDPSSDTLDKIQDVFAAALSLSVRTQSKGISLKDDYARVFSHIEGAGQSIPTGIAELDKALKGGLRRAELGLIMAPPKRGKTTILINLAFGALLAGYNVLYVTYEDGEDAILTRLCCRLLDETDDNILVKEAQSRKDLDTFLSQIQGDLRIEYLVPDITGLQEVQSKLDELQYQEGWKPDVIILDYADKMKPPCKTEKEYEGQNKNYTAVRAAARRWDVAIWTASQGGRSTYRDETPEADGIAGGYGKWGEIDVGLIWCQSRKERALSEGRMSLECLRGRESGGYIRMFMDRSRCSVTAAPPVVATSLAAASSPGLLGGNNGSAPASPGTP